MESLDGKQAATQTGEVGRRDDGAVEVAWDDVPELSHVWGVCVARSLRRGQYGRHLSQLLHYDKAPAWQARVKVEDPESLKIPRDAGPEDGQSVEDNWLRRRRSPGGGWWLLLGWR